MKHIFTLFTPAGAYLKIEFKEAIPIGYRILNCSEAEEAKVRPGGYSSPQSPRGCEQGLPLLFGFL